VLAGDIFQSIQKEPRESVLWHYINKQEDDSIYKIYMSETPRVPSKNLDTLKKALSTYYPEFKDVINNWRSSNNQSNADVEWRSLESYTQVYDELKDFCEEHTAEETMILTFSSAITVKGAMGDVARLRRFLKMNGINVNNNHKRQEEHEYFLTTANSSKGLERDYVICFLTFPLEKAFINLSDDIVVNLITVALTRAKKKVIFYVPKYEDKFSRVLKIFDACPKPYKKIREDDKTLSEFKVEDYLNMEHTVTELIRQQIIKYDTRIKLRENIKIFGSEKLFENNIPVNFGTDTEEEKAFVGVLIENLITSTWSGVWPSVSDRHVDKNPMFNHCSGRIKGLMKNYNAFIRQDVNNTTIQFEGIFCYAQLLMAVTNKIVFTMSTENKERLRQYWNVLKPKAIRIKPTEGDVKIQCNMKMKCLKGVADAIVTKKTQDKEEITVIEIKASSDIDWKEDALVQAMCYALMSGKTWSRIILLNPFMNQKVSYYFNTKKILTLRNYVFEDIMNFNTNCMLAKKTDVLSVKDKMRVENCLFVDTDTNDQGEITQISVVRMVSPIKTEIMFNKYIKGEVDEENKTRKEKFRMESETTMIDAREEISKIVNNPLLNNENEVIVYCRRELDFIRRDVQCSIELDDDYYEDEDDEDEDTPVNKLREIEKYDSLCKTSVFISKVFKWFSFY